MQIIIVLAMVFSIYPLFFTYKYICVDKDSSEYII